jgi:diaminopropionate ammonia-lyase
MMILNKCVQHRRALDAMDSGALGLLGAQKALSFFSRRPNYRATPLQALATLAASLDVGSIHIKDEAQRLGLGSFKALGGSYAVSQLVLDEAIRRLGRNVDVGDLDNPAVRAVAATMTFSCATAGNHGRSVAQGAQLMGARAAIFVPSNVSEERINAIARFGARIMRVRGSYDEAVQEAARLSTKSGWMLVSDTSWPGYERIPLLVMQGYTAMIAETLALLAEPPTHVFIQAGVGGLAAAIAGHLGIVLGNVMPTVVVVEPERAASLYASAERGHLTKIARGEPTVMAMLECYEPSLVAWRILSRTADAFMAVDESAAIQVMTRLAHPTGGDPVIIAGESGGVGLAGLIKVSGDSAAREALRLNARSRVFVINSEGATDSSRYRNLVGLDPTMSVGANIDRGIL